MCDTFLALPSGFCSERDKLEEQWIQQSNEVTGGCGWELTQKAFHQARRKTGEWIEHVQSIPVSSRSRWAYRRYWRSRNKKAAVSVPESAGLNASNRLNWN